MVSWILLEGKNTQTFSIIHFTISMIFWYPISVIWDSVLTHDEAAPCPGRQSLLFSLFLTCFGIRPLIKLANLHFDIFPSPIPFFSLHSPSTFLSQSKNFKIAFREDSFPCFHLYLPQLHYCKWLCFSLMDFLVVVNNCLVHCFIFHASFASCSNFCSPLSNSLLLLLLCSAACG